jgi:hypothetical protein
MYIYFAMLSSMFKKYRVDIEYLRSSAVPLILKDGTIFSVMKCHMKEVYVPFQFSEV